MPITRETKQFSIGPVGVTRASQSGSIIGTALSSNADAWAAEFYNRAAENAVEVGEDMAQAQKPESVLTIDPKTGEPSAMPIPRGLGGIAGEAYQRVVDTRFRRAMEEEIKLKSAEVAVRYENNPNGAALYAEEMEAYIMSMSNQATPTYAGYIQEVGMSYLNATQTNLSIAQIRAERAAAAAAFEQAQKEGNYNLQYMASVYGPSIFDRNEDGQGIVLGSVIMDQMAAAGDDAIDSMMYPEEYRYSITRDSNQAIAKGYIAYYTQNMTDPEKIELVRSAIASQQWGLLPPELQGALDTVVNTPYEFSLLEKFSSEYLGDLKSYATAQETLETERLEQERKMRELYTVTGMESFMPSQVSNFISMATSKGNTVSSVVAAFGQKFSDWRNEMLIARMGGDTEIADAMQGYMNDLTDAAVEGLTIRAVSNMNPDDTDALEYALQTGNLSALSGDVRSAAEGLLDLAGKYDREVVDKSLALIGAWRDSPAKFVQDVQEQQARIDAYDTMPSLFNSIMTSPASFQQERVDEYMSTLNGLRDLSDPDRKEWTDLLLLGLGEKSMGAFFSGEGNTGGLLPTEDQIREARSYLGGGAVVDGILSEGQIALLGDVRSAYQEAKNESAMRTKFNDLVSVANGRTAAMEEAESLRMGFNAVTYGNGNPSSKADQALADQVIESKFKVKLADVLLDPQFAFRPENAELFTYLDSMTVLPESVHSLFSSVASGQNPEMLASAMSLFANLSTHEYDNTLYASPNMLGMNTDTYTRLSALGSIAKYVGSDPEKLAVALGTMIHYKEDAAYKERVDSYLGMTPTDLVADIDGIDSAPVDARRELATLVTHIVATMPEIAAGDVKDMVQENFDAFYQDDGYVVGPNNESRTAYSLGRLPMYYADAVKDQVMDTAIDLYGDNSTIRFGNIGFVEAFKGVFTGEAWARMAAASTYSTTGKYPDTYHELVLQPISVNGAASVQYIVRERDPYGTGALQDIPISEFDPSTGETYERPWIISTDDYLIMQRVRDARSALEGTARRGTLQPFHTGPTGNPLPTNPQ